MEYNLSNFRDDAFGGITAAVVALPLSLAFGVASGLGAIAGLYGAIAVGFFAALFGGTNTQISGPTAPLAVAISVVFISTGESLTQTLTVAVLAGIFQILIGAWRLGSYVAYTPYPVVSGFTTGVGGIILFVTTLPLLGAPHALGGALAAVRGWPDALANINLGAVAVGATAIGVSIIWPQRLRTILPTSVVALVVGTVLGMTVFTDAPSIGTVPTGLPGITLPSLTLATLADSALPALTIALIASINSLLTALVADSMTGDDHNPNRELIGVGMGNVVAGLIGAIPGAGATTGTAANIRAGGRTRVSGVMCATIILALVLGLGRYIDRIPHAVLAGILAKVGFDIIDWRFFVRFRFIQRHHFLVMLITVVFAVFVDLVTAVGIGLIAAALTSARQFELLELESIVSVPLLDTSFLGALDLDGDDDDFDMFSARVGLVKLRGTFTVASAKRMTTAIGLDIREHEVVILDFSETLYVDPSAAQVVGRLIDTALAERTECIVMGMDGHAKTSLDAFDVLRRIPQDHYTEDLDQARELAKSLLDKA
ncbi:MAG: SulP family inorganic anion transporter [Acidimicrobiia bacterium]|nr:SulP family inorganic anion transporter [Acidimicrobiia bacterium]